MGLSGFCFVFLVFTLACSIGSNRTENGENSTESLFNEPTDLSFHSRDSLKARQTTTKEEQYRLVQECLANKKRCLVVSDQEPSGIYIYELTSQSLIWSFVFKVSTHRC